MSQKSKKSLYAFVLKMAPKKTIPLSLKGFFKVDFLLRSLQIHNIRFHVRTKDKLKVIF